MAFSSILCRSASSFAPLAVRALRSQRNCHFAIFTALNQTRIVSSEPRLSQFLPPHSYSTKRPSSDENLSQFPDSEIQGAEETDESTDLSTANLIRSLSSMIQCAEQTDDHDQLEEAPGGFPFKIEDKLGHGCFGFEIIITLSREYRGEEIKVEVGVHDSETEEDSGDDKWDDDDEKANQPCLPLLVSIVKGNGQFIEFACTFYRDETVIGWMEFKNPEFSNTYKGIDFGQLDGNLQKAFHKYIAIRGIKASMANFLYEHMTNKDNEENLTWLKNLKKFVDA